jgi:hypothetical protein
VPPSWRWLAKRSIQDRHRDVSEYVAADSGFSLPMLTFRDASSGAKKPILATGGDMVGVGFVLPPTGGPFTCARVLVVGDLLRRVIEDIHSAQVLAAIITNRHSAVEPVGRSDFMVRPVVGVFGSEAEAVARLGRPLDLIIRVAESVETPPRPTAVNVSPVHSVVPYPGSGPDTTRFALASVNHTCQLNMTDSLLERSRTLLHRWRDRLAEWSRYPSRAIPSAWRSAVVAAFDDGLDVTRVTELMSALEDADDVEPGAKFEAFNYVDRVLAVDLVRDLGRLPS